MTHTQYMKWGGLLMACALLFGVFLASLAIGQVPIPPRTVIEAFADFDPSNTAHIIVVSTRLSRAVIALVVGASLAVSGALMQALTRNPLASPSLFGINAGALFAVVLGTVFFSVNQLETLVFLAFLGGAAAAVMVLFLGALGKDSLSPIRIVLAGAAITALFSAFTQALLVIDEQSLEGVLFWLGGSVSGRRLETVLPLLPYIFVAGVIAFLLARAVNVLTSGEDVAKGLGQRVFLLKLVMGAVIVCLAGGSVAIAGSIGFIGLVVPHMVRSLVGLDYRWILPYCAVFGGLILLLADVAARVVIVPEEMPIGVMTAAIGVPFFIYRVRKGALS